MSCSHAAASRRSASGPRADVRLRAREATPWTCTQRRGRGASRSLRASPSAQAAVICMRSTLAGGPQDVHGRGVLSGDVWNVPRCCYGNNIKHDIVLSMWEVVYLPEAEEERARLPARDRVAVENAVAKLRAMGSALPHPHSSKVEGWEDIRELRPQAGKSPWRPLYRSVGARFVISAIGPEAKKDRRGFEKACQCAIDRLAELKDDTADRGASQDQNEADQAARD
jgi:hypothetical protein